MRSAQKSRPRVLIVDGDAGFSAGCAYILERLGLETNVLYDAAHALTKVDEFHPDLAFVDIGMVDSSGLTIGRLLRDHYARHEPPSSPFRSMATRGRGMPGRPRDSMPISSNR